MNLQDILAQCSRCEPQGQRRLYDRFAREMFLLCRRYVATDTVAEECLMNGFLKVFTAIRQFVYSSDAAAIAWMKKVMVNECLQNLRNNKGLILTSTDEVEDSIAEEDDVLNNMAAAEIYLAVLRLPVGYRTVFNLYVVEGYTHAEIAQLLNIKAGTSKSQLNKAKRMLQQLLTDQNADYAQRKVR